MKYFEYLKTQTSEFRKFDTNKVVITLISDLDQHENQCKFRDPFWGVNKDIPIEINPNQIKALISHVSEKDSVIFLCGNGNG